jgi:hypothetical protein
MVETDDHSDETYWLETETSDDWVSTPHEQVYFRDETPKMMLVSTLDLIKAGALVAKALPGNWTVVITAGPYRGHDVEYDTLYDARRIHLDFYSARPGFQYLPDIIDDVKQGLGDASGEGMGVSA